MLDPLNSPLPPGSEGAPGENLTTMRTQLSQYCEHFVATLRPLLEPLTKATQTLAADSDTAAAPVLADLRELHSQVDSLITKVAEQRAYVLIFGPLKSGKSTLMNAISASYVSEVSSLPAYPCLVFVGHGETQEFIVSDYNGKQRTYTDTTALSQRLDVAHHELAKHIRDAEDAGELFDPQRHFLGAIRRIDVKIPAKNLVSSGTVLVDTPGLYTRMRFGYDRMTREFRNAAATAIFVVKSDTLFLEQVFTEFNQLLELFSRIFLIVNMDTTKRDVGPDGKLVPSLEQKSPDRIIEAFEDLAMPTPLRDAAESGRVQIFPIDLMNAASNALQEKGVPSPGFAEFQDTLNAYLGSTDYLVAFLKDSMQRAQHLLDDCQGLADSEFTSVLQGDIHNVDSQREAYQDELQQVTDCCRLDWKPAFKDFDEELAGHLERASRDTGFKVARDMSAAIETWILSSHSLDWLLTTVWQPLINDYFEAVRDAAVRCYEQSTYSETAGLVIGADLAFLLETIGLDLRALRQAAYQELTQDPEPAPSIPLNIDEIPVRRGVFDVVTLRSEDRVRERLFGPAGAPTNRISARHKASRLGEPAKKFLNQFLLGFREDFFKRTVRATQERFSVELQGLCIKNILEALQERKPKLQQKVDQLELDGSRLRGLLSPLEHLRHVSAELSSKVHALDSQFTGADADKILTPLPRKEPQGKENPKTQNEPS